METIILKKEGAIASVIMNRPARLNATNMKMQEELAATFEEVEKDDSLRVMILTGAGRGFCAGGDHKDMAADAALGIRKPTWESVRILMNLVTSVGYRLYNLSKPTIAMVNGPAHGQGCSMAQLCDIRIGSENASFCVAWLRRGLVPEFGDTWLLPRLVGKGIASEIIFTAREVGAEEAFRIGLLNKLVPASELEKETMEMARSIAEGPPLAIRMAKMNILKGLGFDDIGGAFELLSDCQAMLFDTEDRKEGILSFQEKRKAVFKGK